MTSYVVAQTSEPEASGEIPLDEAVTGPPRFRWRGQGAPISQGEPSENLQSCSKTATPVWRDVTCHPACPGEEEEKGACHLCVDKEKTGTGSLPGNVSLCDFTPHSERGLPLAQPGLGGPADARASPWTGHSCLSPPAPSQTLTF